MSGPSGEMVNKSVKDWIDAPLLAGNQALEEEAIINDIAGSLDLGTLSLPHILVQLRPYVDADQDDLVIVSRGMALLSIVLAHIQPEAMSRPEIHALVLYLCGRIENKEDISNYGYALDEVAAALQIIVKWNRFSPGDASLVVNAAFSLVQGATNRFINQKANTRLSYYMLISSLVKTHQRALERDMEPLKFISGLLELADLEKSASALKVLFTLLADISKAWKLEDTEYSNIWDFIIRYFPITLGAQAHKADLPQPEELRELLLQCIISNDAYAKEAFTSFLRDLDTDQAATKKKELLTTLYACVTSYSAQSLLGWAPKVWDALKFEVWNGENDEFIADSLNIMHGLVSTLSNSQLYSPQENDFSKFIAELSRETFDRLSDMKQYVVPSARILYTAGSASPHAMQIIIQFVLPRLDVMAQDQNSKIPKASLLVVFNHILQARLEVAENKGISRTTSESNNATQARQQQEDELTVSFDHFRQSLVDVYFVALSELLAGPEADISLASAAIQGVVILTKLPGFLSTTEKGTVLDTLNLAIAQKEKIGQLHDLTITAIGEISRNDPDGFRDVTLPRLMEQLPGRLSTKDGKQAEEVSLVVDLLEEIIQVSCSSVSVRGIRGAVYTDTTSYSQPNHDEMQRALSTKFNSVLENKGQLEYANALLAASLRGLEMFDMSYRQAPPSHSSSTLTASYYENILPFIRRIVELKQFSDKESVTGARHYIGLQGVSEGTGSFNDRSIELLGKMITLSMVSLSSQKVENILTANDKAKSTAEIPGIISLFCSGVTEQSLSFSQFDLSAGPSDKCLTTFLSVSLLAGMDRTNQEHLKSDIKIGDVAATMLRNATNPNIKCSQLARMSMLWFIQLLVNKLRAGNLQSSTETRTLNQVMLDLANNREGKTAQEIGLIHRTLAYFAAASLAAYSESASSLLQCMITGITDPVHGRKIAQSFRILLAPSDIINKNNFCVIRPLRKGRLFDIGVKPIIEAWRSNTNKDMKENCLIALAGILAYMEPAMLKDHVDIIFPSVLEGTNIKNDEWSVASYIQIIHTLLPLCPRVIEAHLGSVINRMTDRAHNTYDSPSDSSARCRVTALEVLMLLTEYINPSLLEQRKFKLLSELNLALDDSSREVRHKAEVCKMAWFNLA